MWEDSCLFKKSKKTLKCSTPVKPNKTSMSTLREELFKKGTEVPRIRARHRNQGQTTQRTATNRKTKMELLLSNTSIENLSKEALLIDNNNNKIEDLNRTINRT